MSIPNDQCKKCGEIEPQIHDYNNEGIWLCNCPTKKVDMKSLYEALEAIDKIMEDYGVLTLKRGKSNGTNNS